MNGPLGRRSTLWSWCLIGGWLACVAGVLGCAKEQNAYVAPPPPAVSVATPIAAQVPIFVDENGTTEAVLEAEVRARVQGFIEEVSFEPGQAVEEGTQLYLIEQDEYAAAVSAAEAAAEAATASIATAKAEVSETQARLVRAESEYARWQLVVEQRAGSESELQTALEARDAARANVEAAEAGVKVAEAESRRAEAALTRARLDFDYTTVEAPISGKITKTAIKRGNFVQNGTELAQVVGTDRLYVNFSVSDRDLLSFRQQQFEEQGGVRNVQRSEWSQVRVLVGREIDSDYPFEGTLDYVDQTGVDVQTGTYGLRAVFDNTDGLLVPGLFVRVRLAAGEAEDGLLVPAVATGRDQLGSYVLTVDAEDKVQRTAVTIGRRMGEWVLVREGLEASSRVIVAGLQRAIPGNPVAPETVTLSVDLEQLLRGRASVGDSAAASDVGESSGESEASPASVDSAASGD